MPVSNTKIAKHKTNNPGAELTGTLTRRASSLAGEMNMNFNTRT